MKILIRDNSYKSIIVIANREGWEHITTFIHNCLIGIMHEYRYIVESRYFTLKGYTISPYHLFFISPISL